MLQLHLKQHDRNFRLLDEQKFVQLQNTLDNLMKARAAEGIGTHKRQAKVITETEEEILWDMGLLGVDDPKTLLNTMVYLNGLHFALRANKEHRNLRLYNSQIRIVNDSDEEYLEYREDTTKTNQEGLKHKKITPKVVRVYPNTSNPDRCIVNVFKNT